MKLAVLVQEQPDGMYQARVPGIQGLVVTAPDRELALTAISCAVADDSTWDEFVSEMRAARARDDARKRA